MTTCSLTFGNTQIAHVTTSKQLNAVITKLKRSFVPKNPLFVLTHENNNALIIGLSSKGCYANFINATNEPPYFSSIQDPIDDTETTTVTFQIDSLGTVSEVQRKHLVPFEKILLVVNEFFLTGIRPSHIIKWSVD